MDKIKPFIKWVGGKTQLITDIIINLPKDKLTITTYIEPFIGGGSVLFNILNYFPNLNNVIINDFNPILINSYLYIKNNPRELINKLSILQKSYYNSNNKSELYYDIRNKFNSNNILLQDKISYFIFLNKTCFNGLYRENKSGYFNVPFNNAKTPEFYNEENILNISNFLNKYNVQCHNKSYEYIQDYITSNSFVYLDPPYRPITKSSAFTAYTKSGFNDESQKQLKLFCDEINNKNSYFLLSNSDPKNTDVTDNFFDDLYKDYNILRVKAKRNINSKGDKRGEINEIMIKNYN